MEGGMEQLLKPNLPQPKGNTGNQGVLLDGSSS